MLVYATASKSSQDVSKGSAVYWAGKASSAAMLLGVRPCGQNVFFLYHFLRNTCFFSCTDLYNSNRGAATSQKLGVSILPSFPLSLPSPTSPRSSLPDSLLLSPSFAPTLPLFVSLSFLPCLEAPPLEVTRCLASAELPQRVRAESRRQTVSVHSEVKIGE